jgi:hypothetical protein
MSKQSLDFRSNHNHFNTYLINSRLYKSPKIATHILVHSKNETFNYKYDLVATELLTTTKKLEKSRKCNLQITPFGH